MRSSMGTNAMGKEESTDRTSKNNTPEDGSKSAGGGGGNSYFRVFTYNDTLGWVLTCVAIGCMIAAGVLLPLMNVLFGKLVTAFNDFATGRKSAHEFRSSINSYTLYFVYLFVAKFVLAYVWTTIVSINSIRLTSVLRRDFLKHVLRQEIGYFDSSEPGSVSSTLNAGGNLVSQGISEKFGLTVQAVTTFLSAFVVAFAVQWKLTLITLCVVPLILIVITVCVTIDSGIEKKLVTTWAEGERLAEDVFASIRNVHAFWAYPKFCLQFDGIADQARKIGKKKPPLYAIMFCIQFFSIYAGYGLAFWQGIRMYHNGQISEPGDVVTVILAVILAAQGLTQIAPQVMVVAKASGAAADLFRTIDRASEIDALSTEGSVPALCRGEITFEHVDFSYPSRPTVSVLKGFDLSILANKTTAIVGPSGSGKSTIVALLERWYAPQAGTIKLDGREIQDLNIRWLRTNMRLVQQEPVMFSGTVLQNIAYGLAGTPLEDLPDDEKYKLVEQACRAAYAHEFIEKLPKGYHTEIGQRGAMLSGGQKQRLAIARSIISNPRVLLLDEATSALDPKAEGIVQRALDNVAKDRTTVVIAHRLSTIRNADNIVVMAKGKVIEQGTHHELMHRGGAYSRLVEAQDLGRATGHNVQQKQEIGGGLLNDTTVSGAKPAAAAPAISSTDMEKAAKPASNNYSLMKCLAIIVREQRRLWVPFAILGMAAVIGGGTYPALAILFSRAIEAFALRGEAMLDRGSFFALMFFVMALGNLVAYLVLGWMSAVVAQEILAYYRQDMFNSILRQEMTFFDDADNTTGALVSRLSTEPTALQDLLSSNIALILTITVNLISSCILAIAYGWKLGLVLTFGALPPLLASGYARIRLEVRLDEDTASRFANSAGVASEAVAAIRTVASLALEHGILAKYEDSLRTIARAASRSRLSTMFWYSLSQSMSFLAMALGFWYGGRLISYGEYTPQQFYTVFIAVIFSGEAAASLFTYTSSITQAQGAANYILRLRTMIPAQAKDDYPPRRDGDGGGESPAARIDCKDLAFSYPRRPNVQVLRGVSVPIPAGRFVAFVGPSGCGKTTMINLLERFYEPSSGAIYLDGTDAASLHLGQYRRHLALVQQEPVLYQGSIRENISLGVEDTAEPGHRPPSDEEILRACQQANIDEFIASLPDGLSTPCGSQGLQLSGGQRQRIAIARALVRQPRLLLLDEATSSLDSESERTVQAALDTAAKGEKAGERKRTTVAVAHRLSSVKEADAIFVLSHGRIVEAGTHEDLLNKKGVYYQMCLAQSLDTEI